MDAKRLWIYRAMYRSLYILGIFFLMGGMLLSLVIQPVEAAGPYGVFKVTATRKVKNQPGTDQSGQGHKTATPSQSKTTSDDDNHQKTNTPVPQEVTETKEGVPTVKATNQSTGQPDPTIGASPTVCLTPTPPPTCECGTATSVPTQKPTSTQRPPTVEVTEQTQTPVSTATKTPRPPTVEVTEQTQTPVPTATKTPRPPTVEVTEQTETPVPSATNTRTPRPPTVEVTEQTSTQTVVVSTNTPTPTNTPTTEVTSTFTNTPPVIGVPTETFTPTATLTNTATNTPTNTRTPRPTRTRTPEPEDTQTPVIVVITRVVTTTPRVNTNTPVTPVVIIITATNENTQVPTQTSTSRPPFIGTPLIQTVVVTATSVPTAVPTQTARPLLTVPTVQQAVPQTGGGGPTATATLARVGVPQVVQGVTPQMVPVTGVDLAPKQTTIPYGLPLVQKISTYLGLLMLGAAFVLQGLAKR